MEFIDTPGLHASSTMHAANKALLRKIKAAHKWHKPNYVFYVDR
jgi:GTPase Era involved in 16S rRNA processing